MKQKPMLFKKLSKTSYQKGHEVIGIIGTHHGVGVTHTALMLAFYFGGELGRKTAVLECNTHQDMKLIREAYEWKNNKEGQFYFQNITCYERVEKEEIFDILVRDYECIIIDFGAVPDWNQQEFLRCTKRIVIGGRSAWDLAKLERFTKDNYGLDMGESCFYFIPQADNKTIAIISNKLKRKIWSVPFNSEPTRINEKAYYFFKKLLY
ncbi:MAG: hypothetical protein QM644_00545 [Mobilitalea sp.]